MPTPPAQPTGCIPIDHTVSCAPYTSGFFIDASAIFDSYEPYISAFLPSRVSNNGKLDSSIVTAEIWDQMVASMTSGRGGGYSHVNGALSVSELMMNSAGCYGYAGEPIMYHRSVVCAHDIFMLSANCNMGSSHISSKSLPLASPDKAAIKDGSLSGKSSEANAALATPAKEEKTAGTIQRPEGSLDLVDPRSKSAEGSSSGVDSLQEQYSQDKAVAAPAGKPSPADAMRNKAQEQMLIKAGVPPPVAAAIVAAGFTPEQISAAIEAATTAAQSGEDPIGAGASAAVSAGADPTAVAKILQSASAAMSSMIPSPTPAVSKPVPKAVLEGQQEALIQAGVPPAVAAAMLSAGLNEQQLSAAISAAQTQQNERSPVSGARIPNPKQESTTAGQSAGGTPKRPPNKPPTMNPPPLGNPIGPPQPPQNPQLPNPYTPDVVGPLLNPEEGQGRSPGSVPISPDGPILPSYDPQASLPEYAETNAGKYNNLPSRQPSRSGMGQYDYDSMYPARTEEEQSRGTSYDGWYDAIDTPDAPRRPTRGQDYDQSLNYEIPQMPAQRGSGGKGAQEYNLDYQLPAKEIPQPQSRNSYEDNGGRSAHAADIPPSRYSGFEDAAYNAPLDRKRGPEGSVSDGHTQGFRNSASQYAQADYVRESNSYDYYGQAESYGTDPRASSDGDHRGTLSRRDRRSGSSVSNLPLCMNICAMYGSVMKSLVSDGSTCPRSANREALEMRKSFEGSMVSCQNALQNMHTSLKLRSKSNPQERRDRQLLTERKVGGNSAKGPVVPLEGAGCSMGVADDLISCGFAGDERAASAYCADQPHASCCSEAKIPAKKTSKVDQAAENAAFEKSALGKLLGYSRAAVGRGHRGSSSRVSDEMSLEALPDSWRKSLAGLAVDRISADDDEDDANDSDKDGDSDKDTDSAKDGDGGSDGDDDSEGTAKKPAAPAKKPSTTPPKTPNKKQGDVKKPKGAGSKAAVPPKPATSSGSSNGSSKSSSKLSTAAIVGIAVGGAAFLALLIAGTVLLTQRRRQQSRRKDAGSDSSSNGGSQRKFNSITKFAEGGTNGGNAAYTDMTSGGEGDTSHRGVQKIVKYEYEPLQNDEMKLSVNDTIEIDTEYDDGWATGRNLTTMQSGTFPLTCVE